MRVAATVLVLALLPALAGCTGPGALQAFNVFADEPDVDHPCAHALDDRASRQILLTLRVAGAAEEAETDRLRGVEVLAENNGQVYERGHPDGAGCLAMRMRAQGVYTFWAWGSSDREDCWLSGHISDRYNGEPLVGTVITMQEKCP